MSGQNCESKPGKIYNYLRIADVNLEPDEITDLMRLVPTSSSKKGDVIETSKTRKLYSFGRWCLSSEDHVESRELDTHVDYLLDKLEGRRSTIRSLKSRGYQADIVIVWLTHHYNMTSAISARSLQRLATFQLGILFFDFYF